MRIDCSLKDLTNRYLSLEKNIRSLIDNTSGQICVNCKEEICNESIESAFLAILIDRQKLRYDIDNGWISPAGCRLIYGRPLVCHEFFCKKILNSKKFMASDIKGIIKRFVAIGNRAHGNTHLLCVDRLEIIGSSKIGKMINKIDLLTNEIVKLQP